jgi:hypothetical protein
VNKVEEQVTVGVLPSNTAVSAHVAVLSGRRLRVQTQRPLAMGSLVKVVWNGNVILGEVVSLSEDGSATLSIRHRLTSADLDHMWRNWVTPVQASVK